MSSPTILLTLEDVDSWREELRQLSSQHMSLGRRIAELQKKLADAQPFVAVAAAKRAEDQAKAILTNPDGTFKIFGGQKLELPPSSMFEAVMRVVQKAEGGGLEPKDISKAIKDDASLSDKIKNSHPNYIYTALKRLTDKGQLVRDSQGRYSVPKKDEAA